MSGSLPYQRRLLDDDLDDLLGALPAIAIEGPKGVGKTRTAAGHAKTVYQLDDPTLRTLVSAEPKRVLNGERPILIDEWQQLPVVWDVIRRAVDDGAPPGSFLLTGSASPNPPPTHSGAGRIISMRMRPMSLTERIGGQGVGLATLLSGQRPQVSGRSELSLSDYVEEIVASGLPGIRGFQGRARSLALDGYLRRIVDREVPDEAGISIRNPEALGHWMTAYAAATATSASFEKLRDAATSSANMTPSRRTVQSYRDALTRVWILDELPAWMPTRNHLKQLTFAPKHHLADPALACQLLGMDAGILLSGGSGVPATPNDGVFVGALFESLAALCVRVCASRNDYRVYHMRTARGRQEVDLIVERPDRAVVAFEVKLTSTVNDHDVRHLLWLRDQIGDQLLDSAVLTTGPDAYRRPDGVAVIPLALLGP